MTQPLGSVAEIEALRQRQAETDARFDVLLDEIHFLIGRQFPEDGQF
ncbi:MAG: hypothetical protein SNJ68_13130 [Cyanobacteriota bacterium]